MISNLLNGLSPRRSDDLTHLIYTVDNKFLRYCLVSISSAIRHAHPNSTLSFFIISNGLNLRSKLALFLFKLFRCKRIKLILIDPSQFQRAYLPANSHFSIANYFRLLIPELLPELKRAIYLDSDTLILNDLTKLNSIELQSHSLAAVRMPYNKINNNHLRLGLDKSEPYYNSGVMVLNLAKLRKNVLFIKLASTSLLLEDNNNVDQDLINKYARREIKEINSIWNKLIRTDIKYSKEYLSKKASILHFISSDKPWTRKNHPYFSQYVDEFNKLSLLCRWGLKKSL